MKYRVFGRDQTSNQPIEISFDAADLQAAIRKAAAEAGDFERNIESTSDSTILASLEKAGKAKLLKFEDRDKLQAMMTVALDKYATEIGADAIWTNIKAIK